MAHGGEILVRQLERFGVERVFSVPGESFLAVLDALHSSPIQNVVCRHEGGAAMAAEAHGKLTGTPGVAFVTRGPGACNASSGVHVARQDSTPMILFVGQIARGHRDREAFQEVDYRAMFAPLAKWAAEVDDAERLPEYLARAWQLATTGRPGPVVLALPEDMLSGPCEAELRLSLPEPPAMGLDAAAQRVIAALQAARRPLVVAGGPLWSADAAAALERFARTWDLPVAVSFRRQDYMDNRHPNYAGDLNVGPNPKLAARLGEADLILALGTRLGDIETRGYTLPDPAKPGARLIHVHPDPAELHQVHATHGAIPAHAPALLAALTAMPARPGAWAAWRRSAREDYEAWATPAETPGAVKLEQVIAWLSENLPEDAIVTNGAGNYAAWLHRYFRYKRHGTQLAPTSGSMGYGFPAAIAAKLAHPARTVVCLAGDGCFQMTLNELSTAMQHEAAVIVIVVNNGRYGTIRMHQERNYPGRVSGTAMANPDFAALARAYGGHGEVVTETSGFAPAFEAARAAGRLSVIELKVDADALSPGLTLSGLAQGG